MRTAIDVILAKPTRSPEQLEAMAAKVRRSVDQAETLVDALLTLASSERAMTNTEYVDLATAAEDALERVEPGIAQLELRVEASLDPAETSGDRVLLERLVANLVDNAVRHNDRGGWVHVRTGAKGADSFIEVANSGPAVPDDVLPSLFEPFRRMAERTNAHDGVGLGLAIVQSISAAHSGRLEARSQPQGGLVIALAVPRRGPTEPSTGRS
jgi:signal transduction histidine kinase